MLKLMRHAFAALVFAAALLQLPSSQAAEAITYPLTRTELYELGIAIDTSGVDPSRLLPTPARVSTPFPNRCYGSITVSDDLLERMESSGFSLETFCLALRQAHLAFHPESGQALTRVEIKTMKPVDGYDIDSSRVTLLIDIPRCFARGTPYLDCKPKFNYMSAQQEGGVFYAEAGAALRSTIQQLASKRAFARRCGCADLEVEPIEEDAAAYLGDIRRKDTSLCRVDRVPHCPNLRSRFSPPGSLMMEMEGALSDLEVVLERAGLEDVDRTKLSSERIEISPDLPAGYAHTWHSPEGEPPDPVAPPPKKKGKMSIGVRD